MTGVAAAVAAGVVVVTTTPWGSGGVAPAGASAADVLDRAATSAAAETGPAPRPDQFVYLRAGGEGGTRELWQSVDGTHDGLSISEGARDKLPGCRNGRAEVVGGNRPVPGRTEPCVVYPAVRDRPTTTGGMLGSGSAADPRGPAGRVPGRPGGQDGAVTETLELVPALTRPDLLADPVAVALRAHPDDRITVAEIDPELADTAAFCERYGVPPEESANCVVVAGKRDGELRYLACVVLATTRADVNGLARRALDVRKASFAPMDTAVAETAMEYGGITPIGLPAGWPVLVDRAVADAASVIIGSGVRRSKLRLPGPVLAGWPGVEVVDGLGR